MSNLQKFAIVGSRSFNNYYLLQSYLDKYLPPYAVIITGHATGTDQMTEIYAQTHKLPLEIYESNWEIFGPDAVARQRKDIVTNATQCVAFWDNKSAGTRILIDMFKKACKNVTIIDINEGDIIHQSPMVGHVNHDPFDVYIGRGHDSPFGNPFKITANNTRTIVLALYTDYLLKNPELIKQILSLEGKRLGCWCHSENLCHGDIIQWLLKNAKTELLRRAGLLKENETHTEIPVKIITPELVYTKFGDSGLDTKLSTPAKTNFASGYSRVIQDQYNNFYLEITREQIIRSMIHRCMEDIQTDTENPDKVNLKYRVNDKTNTELLYRQKDFNDDFKAGRYYIKLKLLGNDFNVIPLTSVSE